MFVVLKQSTIFATIINPVIHSWQMERIKKESDLDYSKGEIVMCQLDENIHSYTKRNLKVAQFV